MHPWLRMARLTPLSITSRRPAEPNLFDNFKMDDEQNPAPAWGRYNPIGGESLRLSRWHTYASKARLLRPWNLMAGRAER